MAGFSQPQPSQTQPLPSFFPFQFPPFQFPQFGQQATTPQPFQFPQFPGFSQPAGQNPFSWFSFFQPTTPPNKAAVDNLVSPIKNQTTIESLYPQLTQPAGKVPVTDTDYLNRQKDASKQALLQKLAKYPDYPPPTIPVSKTSVQYGGPPADRWGNTVDEAFDPQTGQLLVPNENQNPPPLISLPPSPDDITQNF
ncbi:hypothetical protein V9T40_006486 [Parthenolecanium corni]|uniref:Uncharacterized protein n=1 Tax=Parthenolecanium corni TaxID=536013 RepID=A0AAN9Y7P5_9HEMI